MWIRESYILTGMGDHVNSRTCGCRRWAVVMLWVWMVSRSICVAHCHGLLFGGDTSLHDPSRRSHGCCSRVRSEVPNSDAATAGRTASGAEVPHSESGSRSCPTQAVIRLADPLDGVPVLGISGPSRDAAPLDQTVAERIGTLRRNDADRSRFRRVSESRWNRGFEPSSILGTGLRCLAPPRRA